MKPEKEYPAEVYLNGSWMKPEQAKISVFDRGFMFGDGIYEVTPYYSGKAFKLKEHLERLQYCLNEVQIIFNASTLEEVMAEALERAGLNEADAAVYVQISRGVAPRTHYYAENVSPTVLIYAYSVKLEGFEEKQWNVLASKDRRWHRCDIKSTALIGKCNGQ
jgi:D-alanine transaminase